MWLVFQRKIYKVCSTRSTSVCHDWGLRCLEIGSHSITWNILSAWRYGLKQDILFTGHRRIQEVPKSHVSQKCMAAPGAQSQLLLLVYAFSKGFSQWIHMRIDVLAPPPAWSETWISQHGVSCYWLCSGLCWTFLCLVALGTWSCLLECQPMWNWVSPTGEHFAHCLLHLYHKICEICPLSLGRQLMTPVLSLISRLTFLIPTSIELPKLKHRYERKSEGLANPQEARLHSSLCSVFLPCTNQTLQGLQSSFPTLVQHKRAPVLVALVAASLTSHHWNIQTLLKQILSFPFVFLKIFF